MKKKLRDNTLKRLLQLATPIRWWLILCSFLSIVAVVCSVLTPELLGSIVQYLYDYWASGLTGKVLPEIIKPLIVLLIIYCIHGLMSYLNMRLMNQVVSRHYSCHIRILISDKIRKLPISYVDQTPVGDILRRMTGDVSEMGGYVHQIFDTAIHGILQIILIAIAMFMEDWRLACFVILLTPLSLVLSSRIASLSEKYFDEMFEKSGKMTELVEESFSNHATTKAYNLEDIIEKRHKEINQTVRKSAARATFVGSIVQPIIHLVNALAYILINLIGGFLMIRANVSVGVIVTIVLYARLFASPLEYLAQGFSQLNRVKAASRRIFSILDMEEMQTRNGKISDNVQGDVVFQNVDFSYDPKTNLISDLNLHAKPGQSIAIVGPTGAGKTTIVNLLMRFYDPDKGAICLDGINISKCSREDVRQHIGMVLQDTWLFNGTIAENVAYGKPNATMEEIRQACIKAHCDHFILTLPDGYETMINDDSVNLSGGQKQLLTIARAILAGKPILILDEATSNVDTRTEILIQQAMDTLMDGKTTFVIAHRLSTIVRSDLILVLDHGKIVEQGTHKELLSRKGFYYDMYTSQYAI